MTENYKQDEIQEISLMFMENPRACPFLQYPELPGKAITPIIPLLERRAAILDRHSKPVPVLNTQCDLVGANLRILPSHIFCSQVEFVVSVPYSPKKIDFDLDTDFDTDLDLDLDTDKINSSVTYVSISVTRHLSRT